VLNSPTENIVVRADQPSLLHPKLLANAQYRLDFADRVRRHLIGDGALTPAAAAARYARRAAEVELAMIAESARWGDYRRDVHPYSSGPYVLYTADDHFATERNRLMTAYFPGRTATVLGQLKAAGCIHDRHSADVSPRWPGPSRVARRCDDDGHRRTHYYTTDGTDPRTPYTGAVAPGARTYSAPIPIEGPTRVKARTRNGTEWSALTETVFETGAPRPPLVITEIHYHPAEGEPYEFIEFRNPGPLTVDVSGYSFDGVSYHFPFGSAIEPGRTIVISGLVRPRLPRGTRGWRLSVTSTARWTTAASVSRSATRRGASSSRWITMTPEAGRGRRMGADRRSNCSTPRAIPTPPPAGAPAWHLMAPREGRPNHPVLRRPS
jgi:hypothetical protein